MRISLELVAREGDIFSAELEMVKNNFKEITAINIPDLLRLDIRSWDACITAKSYFASSIPHIRAIDFNLNDPFPLKEKLVKNNINEILVIEGDPPQDMKKHTYPTSSIKLLKKIKDEMPGTKVFMAVDPYRNCFRKEFDYIEEKIDAGADGFMTQPFFDMRLLDIYAEALKGQDVWWGVSPVVSEKSRDYWVTRNRAYFPAGFRPDMDWNVNFAKDVYSFSKNSNFNFYLMPIKIDLEKYLSGIFR